MERNTSILSQPIRIGNLTATNRFVINAMECSDSNDKSEFTTFVVNRYKNFFEGNAGIVFFESVTLQLESKARKNQLLLNPYDSENIENWRIFVKELKEVNPDVLLIVQINHGGEKSSNVFSRKLCPEPVFGIGGEMVSEEYVDK